MTHVDLAIPESDSPTCEIVGTKLNRNFVSHEDLDVVFPNSATDSSEDRFLCIGCSIDRTTEHGVGKTLKNDCLDLDDIILLLLHTLRLVLALISFGTGCFLSE